jgi:nickel/cobalt transporter (NicO) family protein
MKSPILLPTRLWLLALETMLVKRAFGRLWLNIAVFAFLGCIAFSAEAQPQNPFSLGGIEGGGTKATSGIGAYILGKQAEFTRAMTAAASAIKSDWKAVSSLIALAFAYGGFHAAGPGHGKAIIAAYIVANENALKRGVMIASLAALLQGIVAILLMVVLSLILNGTRQTVTSSIHVIETISFAAIACFGLWLLIKKLAALTALWSGRANGFATHDHFHMPAPTVIESWSKKEAAATIFAAGLRPCSGAILILVFTLSQGILWAGMLAVIAMSLGTALTTSAIAVLSVYAKNLALSLAAGRGSAALWLLRIAEALAALAVMLLGVSLLIGLWGATGGA